MLSTYLVRDIRRYGIPDIVSPVLYISHTKCSTHPGFSLALSFTQLEMLSTILAVPSSPRILAKKESSCCCWGWTTATLSIFWAKAAVARQRMSTVVMLSGRAPVLLWSWTVLSVPANWTFLLPAGQDHHHLPAGHHTLQTYCLLHLNI